MLKTLTTIHEAEKVYDTGGKPILVTCNDIQNWVCKHNHPSKLCNEIIGSKFADIWNIKTPEISLINVIEDHIPHAYLNILQPINFKKTCFGSLYLEHTKELDSSTTLLFDDKHFRRKIRQREDFLKIALFDIWLSNEDRNHNNSNLFLDFSNPTQIYFCVFDHGEIFNSNSLSHGTYIISEDESIIKTDLARKLFSKGKKLTNTVNNLVENFYLCTSECEKELSNILTLIPETWGLDISNIEKSIRENIFTEKWLKECEDSFRSYIQINLNNK